MHVKYMLERAEINRGAPVDVYVVNHHAKKTTGEADDEARRYRRLFNDSEQRALHRDWLCGICDRGCIGLLEKLTNP